DGSTRRLSGFLSCGLCGGSVYVLKQPSRGKHDWTYYVCAHAAAPRHLSGRWHSDRDGQAGQCGARHHRPHLAIPERLEAIAARVVAAERAGETADARRAQLERQLREAKAKVDRYVRAIGKGVDLAEIREQLTAAKTTVTTLEVQIAALSTPAPV